MSYQIILSALAFEELESAVDWYDECEHGLGKRFIEAIDNRLAVLSETPDIFAIKSSGYNEVALEKFPYLIVYRILKKQKKVRILHIFHTSRNPASKK
jgi:plasmid stabilization system protein ParE